MLLKHPVLHTDSRSPVAKAAGLLGEEPPFLPWPKDRKRKDQLCTFLQTLGNHSALYLGQDGGWC